MTRIATALLFGALFACNAHQDAALEADPIPQLDAAEAPAEAQEVVEQAQAAQADPGIAEAQASAAPPSPPELPVDGPTPQMLYDQCRERLEGPESDGECSTDADCGVSGCSQEVCVSQANKGDIMTTCEILPCFGVKDACGCHEGRCTWSLKDQVEPMLPKLPLRIDDEG
jgi:eight-cysteine-cluster-containing protein